MEFISTNNIFYFSGENDNWHPLFMDEIKNSLDSQISQQVQSVQRPKNDFKLIKAIGEIDNKSSSKQKLISLMIMMLSLKDGYIFTISKKITSSINKIIKVYQKNYSLTIEQITSTVSQFTICLLSTILILLDNFFKKSVDSNIENKYFTNRKNMETTVNNFLNHNSKMKSYSMAKVKVDRSNRDIIYKICTIMKDIYFDILQNKLETWQLKLFIVKLKDLISGYISEIDVLQFQETHSFNSNIQEDIFNLLTDIPYLITNEKKRKSNYQLNNPNKKRKFN